MDLDLSPENLAFLVKVGQMPTGATTPVDVPVEVPVETPAPKETEAK